MARTRRLPPAPTPGGVRHRADLRLRLPPPDLGLLNELAALGCRLRELAEPGLDPRTAREAQDTTPGIESYVHRPRTAARTPPPPGLPWGWLWSVRHRHDERTPCREVLSLHRDGTRAVLRIVFRAGPAVMDDRRRVLNLHQPGVVRRLLDEARSRGRLPTGPGVTELDGWPLFDAIAGGGRKGAVG